jgi:ClpX C4-type zinc finger
VCRLRQFKGNRGSLGRNSLIPKHGYWRAVVSEGSTCSFCGKQANSVGGVAQGSAGAAICASCAGEMLNRLDNASRRPVPGDGLRDLYRFHFRDPKRARQFIASISFFITFALVRLIVRSIQEGKGPFHNVSAGGKHIHHLVWGILSLLLVGFVWLHQIGTGVLPPRKWMRVTAVVYGAGSALTLDEFALWLNLADDYFTPQGRESIDAVILFGSILSIGFWGQPFWKELTRRGLHPDARLS